MPASHPLKATSSKQEAVEQLLQQDIVGQFVVGIEQAPASWRCHEVTTASGEAEVASGKGSEKTRHEIRSRTDRLKLFVDFDGAVVDGGPTAEEAATILTDLLGRGYLEATGVDASSVLVYTSTSSEKLSLHVVVNGSVCFTSARQVAMVVAACMGLDTVESDKLLIGGKMCVDFAPYASGSLRLVWSTKAKTGRKKILGWRDGSAVKHFAYTAEAMWESLVFYPDVSATSLASLPPSIEERADRYRAYAEETHDLYLTYPTACVSNAICVPRSKAMATGSDTSVCEVADASATWAETVRQIAEVVYDAHCKNVPLFERHSDPDDRIREVQHTARSATAFGDLRFREFSLYVETGNRYCESKGGLHSSNRVYLRVNIGLPMCNYTTWDRSGSCPSKHRVWYLGLESVCAIDKLLCEALCIASGELPVC